MAQTEHKNWQHIEKALKAVSDMLLRKRSIWSNVSDNPFKQFDAMTDMHVTSEQFALIMANLKMNRVKTVFDRHMYTAGGGFVNDPDAEDSLIDLASYAVLGLGLIYRARQESAPSDTKPSPVDTAYDQQDSQRRMD